MAASANSPAAPTSNITLIDFRDTRDFPDAANQAGVTHQLDSVSEPSKAGAASGRFSATNSTVNRRGAWARAGKAFEPPLNLAGHEALGVWVHGDGKGETLNLQLNSPANLVSGIGEHYIIVNFTGWRHFELIEPDAERFTDYVWPYYGGYNIYRESLHFPAIASMYLYYNNLLPNDTVACHLSPIRALPLIKANWRNPSLTIGGRTIVFPVEMESGSYLEFRSPTDCRLYGANGALLTEVKPQGEVPVFNAGANRLEFRCDAPAAVNPRACVTAITEGEIVRGVNPANKFKGAKK